MKTRVFGLVVFAVFAFSVMVVASASAATLQWLAGGLPITTPQLVEIKGEIEIGTLKSLAGVEAAVLCSYILDGTVGPGTEALITEWLTLAGVTITLASMAACTPVVGPCSSASFAPVNLPLLMELQLMGTEASPLFLNLYLNGGKGEAGWEINCNTVLGLVEETCTGQPTKPFGMDLVNDPTENDVLGTYSKVEQEAEGALFVCPGGTNGFANSSPTDEELLLTLVGGGTLAVSYE